MISASRFASTAAHVTPGYRLGSGGNEERFDRCSSARADMDWRPTAAGADDAHSRAALPCRAGPPADSRLQTAELEGGVKTKRRVALVTGASSGIGRACVQQLACAGLTVYGTSRHPKRRRGRGDLPMLALDVCHDDSVRTCVDRVISETGRIDVLVNNAGVGLEGAVEETSLDEIRAVLETNFFGAVRMMRAVLPIMRKRRGGRIINMGSAAGFLPMPYSAAYSASKHALRGFSESLDHEVRRLGIRVSVIEPGFVRTDIVEHSTVAAAPFEPYISARSNPARAFRQAIARGVDPNVVARTVVEAATEQYPRLRYLPDGTARVVSLFRDVLPSTLFDFAFRKQIQMNED